MSLTKSYSWLDYFLFCLMYSISVVIGIYYGCFGNKQSTINDYLYGGKKMGVIPLGMSMIASGISGIALLGIPAEIYMFGTQFWMLILGIVLMGLINNYVYLPVFYKLQLASIYEYLQLRFNRNLRKFALLLFIISTFLYLPIVIYPPALAFNQVTGFNMYYILIIMSAICIFYTTIGGLKSVIWTDTLQFAITLCTLLALLIVGTISVDGFAPIWKRALDGDRIEFFNMNPDPTLRISFWSVVLNHVLSISSLISVNPSGVQRFLSTSSLAVAKRTSLFYVVGAIITYSICCFFGLIIYARYYDCDPVSTGQIEKSDQIMQYFVTDMANTIPGISGLFGAGIFSASLTTLSTYLNTLSGLIYNDCIMPFFKKQPSERHASNIMKLIAVALGMLTICFEFVVEKLGTIIEIWSTLNGITGGSLLGLFTLGMLFPFANTKGAFCGGIASILILSWMVIKTKLLMNSGYLKYHPKTLHTYGCNFTSAINQTIAVTAALPSSSNEDICWLYKISFQYYIVLGTLITLVVGLLVSWITAKNNKSVNPELISPFLRRFISNSAQVVTYQAVQKDIPSNEN